jgi:TRAP-type C4-dicarboxylate transport system permease small subunit
MKLFVRLHEIVAQVLFFTGASAITAITAIYCFEIVARYFFHAPTGWANDAARFLFSIGIFMCLPQITRDKSHIAVTLVFGMVSKVTAKRLNYVLAIIAALICLVAAAMTAQETLRQFYSNIITNSSIIVPKYWVTFWMPYGFLSAGLFFFQNRNTLPESEKG